MKSKFLIIVIISVFFFACKNEKSHMSSLLQYDAQITGIIEKMTLEEKINMLHGKHMFVSAGVERLGIADMNYADGPFGIREELQADAWAPLGLKTDSATFFPTGSALAATWSPELAYAYGTGMAREARLRGKDMILGPAINIQRIPTGGRTYEYLSEDPFLNARLSVGYTKGVQDNGVAVCLKHYALNNQESNRGNVNVVVGDRTMREIYLPAFEAAVREADAYGVMAAYNKVNGWWCSENDMLQNKILRDEWGFAGFVISDWGGTHSTVDAVVNGLNIEMPGKKYLGEALLDSVRAGAVSEEIIDRRVREILRVRLAIKPVPEEDANKVMTSQPEQQKIAYDVAARSIVMLKNEGILPIDLNEKPVIAVIGDNAGRIMASGGVGAGVKALYEITPLKGLQNRIADRAEIIYAQGYEPEKPAFRYNSETKMLETIKTNAAEVEKRKSVLTDEALRIASKADVVLFIGGDNRFVESEGSDRKDIMLPFGQDELIKRISEINPNIVTILVSGAPNDLNVVREHSKALIISWFNGSEGGNALADILIGNISPSGHLPFTLPVKLEDSPAYALGNFPQAKKTRDIFMDLVSSTDSLARAEKDNAGKKTADDPNNANYSEGSLVGYRWFDTKNIPVMYPFGYGLSYTTFGYSSLSTDKEKYSRNDIISLSFDLENTGAMKADEVVQAYVHRINSDIEWPYKELKAFARLTLEKGESRKVRLEIPVKNLYYWNENINNWDYDPCQIEVMVGSSAGDIKLQKMISLK
ncbi:MAG: glycoside hydrolase family 3 C-terminal domain-containing protein [Bacteroidales bacterium]|nr:glycoside hydrolase family 3 C-terminal domain-containing protein [Bacteroidales bacterium]